MTHSDDPNSLYDDHDDSLGGTQGRDTSDPYTLLPILVAGAKVVYVVLCVVALALFTLLLFSPNAEAGPKHPEHPQHQHPLQGAWWGLGHSQSTPSHPGGAAMFHCVVDPAARFHCASMARTQPDGVGIRRGEDFAGVLVPMAPSHQSRRPDQPTFYQVIYDGEEQLAVALHNPQANTLTVELMANPADALVPGFIEHTVLSRGAPERGSGELQQLLDALAPYRAD
jgi:hypothetical protein